VLRATVAAERATLESQLAALERIKLERSNGQPPQQTADVVGDDVQNNLVAAARQPNVRWWPALATPAPRTTRQNSLMRYRSAETKRFLAWLRKQWYPAVANRTEAMRRTDGLGSPYDAKIPTSAQEPSVTQVDHTVAQSWTENTQLLQEFAHVTEDITNIMMIPANQNSKKGARPVRFVSDDPTDPQKVDHSWFASDDPRMFTGARQAAVASRILYMFLSNPLITQQQDSQSSLDRQGAGCSYYANNVVRTHLLDVVRQNTSLRHDVFANLVCLFVYRVWNPLLSDNVMLQTHAHAVHFRELLHERLSASTSFPAICGAAIRGSVALFPGS
jgi:hypothetical protein